MQCLYCQCETSNPRYCSKKCSATSNSKRRIKKIKHCKHCNVQILTQNKYCAACFHLHTRVDYDKLTLQQCLNKSGNRNKYNSTIRSHARKLGIENKKLNKCYLCPYDTHVDCCHIKPVESFTMDTVIAEVNKLDNLIGLCRNHHWELDNNIICIVP